MIVRADDVPQRGEALLDALDFDGVGQRVAQVLEFLVGCGCGDEQALAVARREAPDDARSGDRAVRDGDDVRELGFEDRIEVRAGAEGDEAVGVGEGGEDADSGSGRGRLVWVRGWVRG